MGYFVKQMYNEPESMYVDPRLDILANSLGAVQKRHDENYAAMNAFDIMANNIEVADGDRALKDAALAKLKEQQKAIADSGDYAYASPRIGMAVRDFSTNQDLTMAQQNMMSIKKAEEQAQAMGANALDFNPSKNWTTIDPTTGKARRFTSGVEKKEDWDGTAQEVTKIMANQRPIGLTKDVIDGYLVSGNTSGISKDMVDAYLDKATSRFVNTAAGKQMYRKLTEIDKLAPEEADHYIKRYLNNVGDAQIYSKTDLNHQVDSYRTHKEDQSFQKQMHKDDREFQRKMKLADWKHEDEQLKKKLAADMIKEQLKAKGKTDDTGEGEALPSYSTGLIDAATRVNEKGEHGTTLTNEDAKKLLQVPTTKIKTNQGDMDAMFISGKKTISPTRLVPGAERIPDDLYAKGRSYFSVVNDYNSNLKQIENRLAELKGGTKDVGDLGLGDFTSSETWFPTRPEERTAEIKELETKQADLQNKLNVVKEKNKDLLPTFEKHKDVFSGKKSNLIVEAGKAIEKLNIPSVIDNTRTKNFRVKDGDGDVDMIGFPKAEDLINLGEEKVNTLIETGALVGLNDFDELKGKTKKTDMDEKTYQLHYSTKVPINLNTLTAADAEHYGTTNANYQKNVNALRLQASDFMSQQPYLNDLLHNPKGKTPTSTYHEGRKELLDLGIEVIKNLDVPDTKKAEAINDYKHRFAKFNDLSEPEKRRLLDEANAYREMQQQQHIQLQAQNEYEQLMNQLKQ